MTIRNILATFLAVFAFMLPNLVNAADHTVNAEVRAFTPGIIYIALGDTVKFTNMTSHNAVSYVAPEGGTAFGESGKLPGGSFAVTPDKEGIWGYACEPHIGFGMVGVIVVGEVSADDVAATKAKAMEKLQGPFKRIIGKINKINPTK